MTSTRLPLERKLERDCVLHAERDGWRSVKLDNAARGWPDRLFLGPNSMSLLVEFKRPGQQPRPQQAAMHIRLRELGHPVSVVDNFDDFKELIANADGLAV